jgi:hypothetical protein
VTIQQDEHPMGPLQALPPLLRGNAALADVLGRSNATLAAPASVQPFALVGLAHFS